MNVLQNIFYKYSQIKNAMIVRIDPTVVMFVYVFSFVQLTMLKTDPYLNVETKLCLFL
jgi:hypothetical protein